MSKFPQIDALKLNYVTNLEACYHGALIPPTNRSLGIAIRPSPDGKKPVLKCYFQPNLMELIDFYIGDYIKLTFTDTATHIKIERVEQGGCLLQAAANNDMCLDYDAAKKGTQFRARMGQTMGNQFLGAFTFDDKCNVFVEPSYIRKGSYMIAPLDDMPIYPVKK